MGKEVLEQGTNSQNAKWKTIRVGIIGVTGYTGIQLYKLLLSHPYAEITYISSEEYINQHATEIFPYYHTTNDSLICKSFDPEEAAHSCDLIFLALPHTVSVDIVPQLIKAKNHIKIIDLSADFRFQSSKLYKKWYGKEHSCPELLKLSTYGLSEIFSERIKKSSIVANPGCYPTSILIPLVPLCKYISFDMENIVISSISGVSGAGRKPHLAFLFPECNENIKAYAPMTHRHIPEIESILAELSSHTVKTCFTPHVAPVTRGILSTICLSLFEEYDNSLIYDILTEFYKRHYFIRIYRPGVLPGTKEVIGTNYCSIGFYNDKSAKRLIIVSALDNLIKGASGQAIQNMNLMYDFPVTTGLLAEAQIP